ncbi:uncharacterized protein BKA55DRAFT_504119 [Fusarium redolens]|uniref:Uncharacterized protein n=1 Tax=Fusarium redolens TaxID=48865 RepID=A0A9P9HQI8_FUSRE|nr:uncharacterized protein BKA55DRAFT_504119 [Fusarium redolens]KAH7260947.1 hypothetical protein BKA55DRAFT_504119 [Fusarium redolens]
MESCYLPAALKEPDPHFHKFPDLPRDVRLLIWEASLRPRPSKNYNAVHSFRVENWEAEDERSHETIVGHKSPKIYGGRNCSCRHHSEVTVELETGKMTTALDAISKCPEEAKSAFHWDYGMWTACAESRWVISRRFRKNQWRGLKKAVVKDLNVRPLSMCSPLKVERAWQEENRLEKGSDQKLRRSQWYEDFASVINIDDMFFNIVATHPARDLFIIHDERWMHTIVPQATIQAQEQNAIKFFQENAISATSTGSPIIGNIGFVYDSNWVDGLTRNDPNPTTLSLQRISNNPRGHFLLLLYLCVMRMLSLRLWLIDYEHTPCDTCKTKEDAEEEEKKKKKERKVFYRYGEEDLVEVDIQPNVMWVMVDNARCILGTSCGFAEYLSGDPLVTTAPTNPDPFDVWKCVGVLAPRSKVPCLSD